MAEFLRLTLFAFMYMVATVACMSITYRRFATPKSPETAQRIVGIWWTILVLVPLAVYAHGTGLWIQWAGLGLVVLLTNFIISHRTGWIREAWVALLCLTGALLIPPDMPAFNQVPAWILYPLLGGGIYLSSRLFTLMDRVQDMSLLSLCAQGLFLFLARTVIPAPFIYPVFYIIVITLAAGQVMKSLTGRSVLGPAAGVCGLMLGVVGAYTTAKGYPLAWATLFSYDILEVLWAGTLTLWATHKVYPFTQPFLAEQAATIQMPDGGKRLKRRLCFLLLSLSLIAYLWCGKDVATSSLIILWILILAGIVYFLKNWGTPPPAWRDIFGDLKAAGRDLKTFMTTVPLKNKDTPVSNTPISDSTPDTAKTVDPRKRRSVKSATSQRTRSPKARKGK